MPLGVQALAGIAGAADGIVSSLMNGFNNLFPSKVEKEEAQAKLDAIQADLKEKLTNHLTTIAQIQADEYKAQLADVSSARDMNVKVEETEKSSWLSKNIAPILGTCIVGMWVVLTCYMVAKILNLVATDPKINTDVLNGMYTTLTAVAMVIVNFYFGSSHGSKDKDKIIQDMASQQNN